MRPAARSSSASVMAAGKSPRSWRPRPAGSPTRTAASSRPSRSRRTHAAIGRHLPVDGPAIYPVSGGSEAIETALKLARAYYLARGETERWIVFSRWGELPRQHPRCAGPVRAQAAPPPVRGLARAVPARLRGLPVPRPACPAPMRWPRPPSLPPSWTRAFEAAGPGTVAAFVAEPIVGATLAAAVPPDDYWPAIAEVCRRHGVLLIADEVMTGFGRTGRWFAPRPLGRPARTCSWPPRARRPATGRSASSPPRDEIHDTVRAAGGFVHGFTYSHDPVGAAVAGEVLRILESESLVEASAAKGDRLRVLARGSAGRGSARRRDPRPWADGRPGAGRGPATAGRRSRGRRASPRRSCASRASGACSSTRARATRTASTATRSCSGPPFVITEDEIQRVVETIGEVVESVVADPVV